MEEWGNGWVPHHRLLYVLYGKIEDRRMEDLIHDHVVPYVQVPFMWYMLMIV